MIKGLAYVGLGVADVPAWRDVAVGVFGMQSVAATDGAIRLRMDEAPWRIALAASDANDLQYAGFDVDGPSAAEQLAARLAASGVATHPMSADEARLRGVAGGFRCADPDGLAIEIVHGVRTGGMFESALGTRFVTGALGLGHIVVTASDAARSLAFYERLGMAVSDYITVPLGPVPEVRIAFLHCNPRHHTLALLPLPMPQRVNHLMFEVDSVDEVIRAYYRAVKRGLTIVRHLGRHSNDRMLSFYARTPAGFDIELGCDGLQVGPQWQIENYRSISIWGHEDS